MPTPITNPAALTPETRLVTRDGKPAKFIAYVPEAVEDCQLVYLHQNSLLYATKVNGAHFHNDSPFDILLADPLTFPPPPPGREWHNPENFTPEQIAVDKGWRLRLKDEPHSRDDQVLRESPSGWVHTGNIEKRSSDVTYRTRAPLPFTRRVPLTDIPLGTEIRRNDWDKTTSAMVIAKSATGVSFYSQSNQVFATWEELAEHWERRDGDEWRPCWKEVTT